MSKHRLCPELMQKYRQFQRQVSIILYISKYLYVLHDSPKALRIVQQMFFDLACPMCQVWKHIDNKVKKLVHMPEFWSVLEVEADAGG